MRGEERMQVLLQVVRAKINVMGNTNNNTGDGVNKRNNVEK